MRTHMPGFVRAELKFCLLKIRGALLPVPMSWADPWQTAGRMLLSRSILFSNTNPDKVLEVSNPIKGSDRQTRAAYETARAELQSDRGESHEFCKHPFAGFRDLSPDVRSPNQR